jgi:3-isopropylmalate/(R)-2-methylmalate dehydratase large subunit
MSAAPRTLIEKIWDEHVIASRPGWCLLHIDRHMVQETTSARAFRALDERGIKVGRPDLTLATQDHLLSTRPDRTEASFPLGMDSLRLLRMNCAAHGVRVFPADSAHQGIAHVVAPEQGFALPGTTLVCGDSHTATSGGVGALAWGIGTTEVGHVLATQALWMRRPRRMRVRFEGMPGPGVVAKDLILSLIGRIGTAAGTGHFVEYAGSAVRALPVEGRMTLCNMSIEFGARCGLVAPDEATFAYLRNRPQSPKGELWEPASEAWAHLPTDDGASFDQDVEVDCAGIEPHVSWGTNPQQVAPIGGIVPDPERLNAEARDDARRALAYMDLPPGTRLEQIAIDMVFIGSCTNGRLSDLKDAARVAAGRRVAPGVRAIVVPGSREVRREAEALGLDKVFREAGFEWREAGCSMCVSINDDIVPPGARCASTSNRNFENRQGRSSRTHLCSPAVAAATAVMGRITDPRRMAQ